jgi:general secretion pathway protein H
MGRKVEQAQQPTSPAGSADAEAASDDEAGFTLIEIVCIVAILSMIAAILLPAIPRGTPRARIEAYALEAASLLKADRSAAMRRGIATATVIDPATRSLRSGVTGRIVRVPNDVILDATLAARCNGSTAGNTIGFFASGMSCGGTIALTRRGVGYQVRVNWLTGGVEVVPLNAL